MLRRENEASVSKRRNFEAFTRKSTLVMGTTPAGLTPGWGPGDDEKEGAGGCPGIVFPRGRVRDIL